MIRLSLADIAQIVGGRLDAGTDQNATVDGPVHTDSRLVVPGAIFFALPGALTDGALFAEAAVAAGAALVIAERELELDAPVIVVPDGVAALAALATDVVARVRAGGTLSVVAITGSNGKTTTKNLLRAILGGLAPTVAPQGSFNNHVGAPISMLGIDYDTRYLVVEMGANHAGEIARLVAIANPDIGVVLKVGLAHVGEFGGIDAVQRAKSEMVTDLRADAVALLNADDDRVAAMAGVTAATVRWFGLSATADVRAEDIEATSTGTRFTLVVGDSRMPVRLRILGEHHVQNALAALSVARELGLDLAAAVAAIEAVARAERWRMELLLPPSGAIVINDAYNASPDSMAAALKTLAQVRGENDRTIAVLGEMAELGEYSDEEHDRIGRLVVRLNIRKLIVVGHAARHIHNAAGLEGSWDGESVFVETPDEAYDLLREDLGTGDIVLVKSSKSANLRFLGDRLGGVSTVGSAA
ncbi:MAG: UDP-N-acetylmuramoyl-tripeptide--D-alanyl-D-alanine ligase [Actinomycetota bacterium]|nr:UDP-N-acetylmuramoyl-tripeptide--D-alanyl-D-alanine ligase [Actinomycetota bacterium]